MTRKILPMLGLTAIALLAIPATAGAQAACYILCCDGSGWGGYLSPERPNCCQEFWNLCAYRGWAQYGDRHCPNIPCDEMLTTPSSEASTRQASTRGCAKDDLGLLFREPSAERPASMTPAGP